MVARFACSLSLLASTEESLAPNTLSLSSKHGREGPQVHTAAILYTPSRKTLRTSSVISTPTAVVCKSFGRVCKVFGCVKFLLHRSKFFFTTRHVCASQPSEIFCNLIRVPWRILFAAPPRRSLPKNARFRTAGDCVPSAGDDDSSMVGERRYGKQRDEVRAEGPSNGADLVIWRASFFLQRQRTNNIRSFLFGYCSPISGSRKSLSLSLVACDVSHSRCVWRVWPPPVGKLTAVPA